MVYQPTKQKQLKQLGYKRKTEFRFLTLKEMWADVKLWWEWFKSKW